MVQDVFLTLRSIRYTGQSIGNDIGIEIEAIGQSFEKNYEINRGTTRNLEESVGKFTVDQRSFSVPVTIRIIERDWAHNDVGETRKNLKVDLSISLIQSEKISVEVAELGWAGRKRKATFDVVFDMQVMQVMHYIEEQEDGFVIVKLDGYPRGEEEQGLSAFLKVRLDRHEGGRDYFTIMEGWRQGETGSVRLHRNGASFLIPGNPYTGPIRMTYSKSTQRLTIKRKSYQAIEDPEEPWAKGFYDIEIADYSHAGGISYESVDPKAKVWFHIGHERSLLKDEKKFIHRGAGTLGCITLTEPGKWDEVYNVLIRARLGDSKSVGILEVTD